MKKAIICAVCERPMRYSDTYAVKIIDYRIDQAIKVEKVVESDLGAQVSRTFDAPARKVKVCRDCANKMGYKTNKRRNRKK